MQDVHISGSSEFISAQAMLLNHIKDNTQLPMYLLKILISRIMSLFLSYIVQQHSLRTQDYLIMHIPIVIASL